MDASDVNRLVGNPKNCNRTTKKNEQLQKQSELDLESDNNDSSLEISGIIDDKDGMEEYISGNKSEPDDFILVLKKQMKLSLGKVFAMCTC